MKRFGFCSLLVLIVIALTADDQRTVIAQDVTDYWTPLLASIPTAVMGAINLALVNRLASDPSGTARSAGLTQKLGLGQLTEGQKMLFVGKHNIQVSNHEVQKNEEIVEDSGGLETAGDYQDCDDCEYEDDEDYNDYDDEYEYTDDQKEDYEENNDYKEKPKYTKNEENEEEDNDEKIDDDYKQIKQIKEVRHVLVYPEHEFEPDGEHNSDHDSGYSGQSFGDHESDYKKLMFKSAINEQYPHLNQDQVYWPDSDESKGKVIFQTESLVTPQTQLISSIGDKVSDIGLTVPTFKDNTFSTSQIPNGILTINELTSQTPANTQLLTAPTYDSTPDFKDLVQAYKNDMDMDNSFSNYMRRSGTTDKPKRVKRAISLFPFNRWPKLSPLKQNRTSTKVYKTQMSPEEVRILLTGSDSMTPTERIGTNRPHRMTSRKVKKNKSNKSPKKRHKYDFASSKRVVKKTKRYGDDPKYSVTYLPIAQYEKILNYPPNTKKSDKRKKKGKTKYNNNDNSEDEMAVTDDDYYYYDDDYGDDYECDDCDYGQEYYDNEDKEGYGKSHTTVQVIEPDSKFNGFGGWIKKKLFSKGSD